MHDLLLSFGNWLENTPLDQLLDSMPGLGPFLTAAHFFGFFLVIGTTVAVDLRILGLAPRRQSASELAEQLFPWTWTGLGLVFLTGFLMFVQDATTFLNSSFFLQKLFVALLGTIFVFLIQWNVRKWERPPAAASLAKVMATISLLLWLGTILLAAHVPLQTCE